MARMAEPGRALLWEGILTGGPFLGGNGRAIFGRACEGNLVQTQICPKMLHPPPLYTVVISKVVTFIPMGCASTDHYGVG